MKKPYKMKLVVPSEIRLAGVTVEISFDDDIELTEDWGMYWPAQNQIRLISRVNDVVKFECFCHELSEAIADKFVNTSNKKGDEVPHETIDAYGRGIFNFLAENIQNILVVDDGE
jgi:hypothetical protein